eukprot:c11296_g1_i3.p1 GENE.c11296_g1_i3~~c11296_g1_i3.p1  ORF type:complete len:120 (-),score=31.85 c11296_g1_i3:217-576(-)
MFATKSATAPSNKFRFSFARVLVVVSVFALLDQCMLCVAHPDDNKPIHALVREKGFTFEAIPVQTQDGYVCTIHHIGLQNRTTHDTKGVVLLHHGFRDSSDAWCVQLICCFAITVEDFL